MVHRYVIGAIVASVGAAASAQNAQFVNFDSDSPGTLPGMFVSDDSALVTFTGSMDIASTLKTDGRGLRNFGGSPLRLDFARPVTSFTTYMGNDDSGFLGGADVFTRARAYLNGTLVQTVVVQNNGDDLLNDGVSVVGMFDRVDIQYVDASGAPSNLAEIVDNISFCVSEGFVDFNSDPLGGVSDGFESDDSPLVRFRSTDNSGLRIDEFGTGKTDGRSLLNSSDDASGVRMTFARPVAGVSVQMGNDDGAFVGGTVYTTLRGFYEGSLVETVTYQNNSNNDLDDGPGISGILDRVDVFYTDAAGNPIGLTEIIDNIAFSPLSQVIDFESDLANVVPNGFVSNDSPIVQFSDTVGADLQVGTFGAQKTDGQGLFCLPDDEGAVLMQFQTNVCCLALEFGNDDPSRAPSYAQLTGYRNSNPVRVVRVPTNNNDALDQTIAIEGDFDAVEFRYTNQEGGPIPSGLIEAIDNIRFAVKKQFIDFNDDPTGGLPNGFVSNDSPLLSFSDSDGADLRISAFGGNQSDGPGLGVFGDDSSALGMNFVTAANTLSIEFGNDTATQSTRLRGFLGAELVAESVVAHDGDDQLNQTVSISGLFDRAELIYIFNSNGAPANRIEIVDNICFDVATGRLPCNSADLAAPFGVLDLNDISAFINAFVNQLPPADLDDNNIYDLNDISSFISAFTGGCL